MQGLLNVKMYLLTLKPDTLHTLTEPEKLRICILSSLNFLTGIGKLRAP